MLQTFLIIFILLVSLGVFTLSEGRNDPPQGWREGKWRIDGRQDAFLRVEQQEKEMGRWSSGLICALGTFPSIVFRAVSKRPITRIM